MSYTVFTDACSNLPNEFVREEDIRLLPCTFTIDGEECVYSGDIEAFDSHGFYERLRSGAQTHTTLLNSELFIRYFAPELKKGNDIIYIGMSSGISGTFQAARAAADELLEKFPERCIRLVDSLGAGMGVGMLCMEACDLRREGENTDEAADILERRVMQLFQFFTVDDLNFLKRTGRVSGATAMIGTAFNIKPLLWGDMEGHIVARKKCIGRKNAIEALVEQYKERAVDAGKCRVAISHGDCPEDAKYLAERICETEKPRELIIVPHEPMTGAHVGPGMLAVFFFGEGRQY